MPIFEEKHLKFNKKTKRRPYDYDLAQPEGSVANKSNEVTASPPLNVQPEEIKDQKILEDIHNEHAAAATPEVSIPATIAKTDTVADLATQVPMQDQPNLKPDNKIAKLATVADTAIDANIATVAITDTEKSNSDSKQVAKADTVSESAIVANTATIANMDTVSVLDTVAKLATKKRQNFTSASRVTKGIGTEISNSATVAMLDTVAESATQEPEKRGFTKLPHFISEYLIKADFTTREFKVFLLVLRETLGWNREWSRIRRSDFELRTGIHWTHISKTTKALVECGAIRTRTIPGESGIQYSVAVDFLSKLSKSTETNNDGQGRVAELDTIATSATIANSASVAVLATNLVANTATVNRSQNGYHELPSNPYETSVSQDLKKDLNKIKENSLSTNHIEEYFASIQAPKKKKTERENFESLKKAFSLADIELSIGWIISKGTLDGKPCYSPMAYLAHTLPQVLDLAKIEQRRQQTAAEHKEALKELEYQEIREREERQRLEDFKQKKFYEKFNTDLLANEAVKSYSRGYMVNSPELTKIVAISNWWNNEGVKLYGNEINGNTTEGK